MNKLEGEKHTTSSNSFVKNGKTYFERIKIVETWNNFRPITRYFATAYIGVSVINFFASSYYDAKNELYLFKKKNINTPKGPEYSMNEWNAVYEGANINSCENFFNSIVFPYTIFSKVTPFIVLQLNKDP